MTTLGKYALHEQLGKGGFGTVYRATDTTLDRVVALKVLHPQLMVDDVFINRFKKEARALAALENHHIVTIHEISEMDGRISIAMRYLAGGNLKQIIKNKGPLPLHEASEIILQVLKGLKAAHEHGFIHRDLKPENILSDGQGEYVITDLGLVRDSQGSASSSTGGITGTPNYIAPEIWRGKPATPSTDIYSVGCILYELLTGRVLFDGDTPAYVMMQHLLEGPQLSGHFSPEVEKLLQTALAQDPADRFSSVGELSTALRELSNPLAPTTPPVQSTPSWSTEAEIVESVIEPSEEEQEIHLAGESVPQILSPSFDQTAPVGVVNEPQRASNTRAKLKKIILFIVGGVAIITLLVLGIINGWFTPKPAASATEASVMLKTDTPTNTVMPPKATQKTPTATSIPPTPTEAYTIGSTMVSPIDGMTMVYVPAGEFLMGSLQGVGYENEHPQHTVYLDGYWIDQTEVTNAMYAKCVASGKCTKPSSVGSYSRDSYYGNTTFADFPVIHVDWYQAQDYCEWAERVLPTEAEWEKAARGNQDWIYPWGNWIPNCNLANYLECSNDTISVGSLLSGRSPYGALNMAGNVWEWALDCYGDYQSEIANCGYRVLRGGAWYSNENNIRSTYRSKLVPSTAENSYGFRCSLPVTRDIAEITPTTNSMTTEELGTKQQYQPSTESITVRTQVSQIDGMTMVYVPAGEFLMGSLEGVGFEDERPLHSVYLDGYWIDQTEVTNSMYERCVADRGCTEPETKEALAVDVYYGNPVYEDYPVVSVNWYQAWDYCDWAGRKLPTEAQWEKAARGTDGRTYPWGNVFSCSRGNFKKESLLDESVLDVEMNCDGYDYAAPVGSFSTGVSPYGALDMAGNVREWVDDWFKVYTSEKVINPIGPSIGVNKVLRGGSWNDDKNFVRTTNRIEYTLYHTSGEDGFRCSLSETP